MESVTTESAATHDQPAPIAPIATEPPPMAPIPDRSVEVDATTAHIRALTINRPSIVAYLRSIPESKQEIALLHALEVGITELAARRERFKH